MAELAIAAVALRTALKYRKNWNKTGPTVKLLRSLMPSDGTKQGYRLYIDIGDEHKQRFHVPAAVKVALQKAGYRVTDYLAKKCVKISDKEQKNEFNIGKVIAKDEHAKRAFDNDPQLQNSKANKIQVVISCHPYDIIGMSTGRAWDKQSCMRLNDGKSNKGDAGSNHRYVQNDVAEGTLVAYAINASDTNIQKPLCRCLLKPFVSEEHEEVLYRRETGIYGNPVPGFNIVLAKFLRRLNAKVPEGFYRMVDSLYDDGAGRNYEHTEESDDLRGDSLADDPHLLVDYVRQFAKPLKENLEKGDDGEAWKNLNSILHGFSNVNGQPVPDEDLDEIVEMLPHNNKVVNDFLSNATIEEPNRMISYIGRKLGAFEMYRNMDQETKGAMQHLPNHYRRKFAQSGGDALKRYVGIMEEAFGASDSFDRNTPNYDETINGLRNLLDGRLPFEMEAFADAPLTRNYLYTVASAARFVTLGNTDVESYRESYAIFAALDGNAEKQVSENAAGICDYLGSDQLFVCYLLDNDGPNLDEGIVFLKRPELVSQNVLKNRRFFRALDRCKSRMVQFFMDHVKFAQFKECVVNRRNAQYYKDNRASIVEYMNENTEMFTEVDWTPENIAALANFDTSMLKQIVSNTNFTFDKRLYQTVSMLFGELLDYNGPAIDIDENSDMELVMRTIVCAGRLMEPPVEMAAKFAFPDMSNEDFFQWYKENKLVKQPLLTELLGQVSSQYSNPEAPRPDLLKVMDWVIAEAPANPLIFGRFSTDQIVKNHKQIMASIMKMPNVYVAASALGHYVESMHIETVMDSEGIENQVEYRTSDLDSDDPAYETMYEAIKDEVESEWETKNDNIVQNNAKLLRIANGILVDVGRDSGDPDEMIKEFFDVYPEHELEDAENALDSLGEEIYSHVMNMIDEEQLEKENAGY